MRDYLASKPATFVEVLRRRARQQPYEPGYTFLTDGDAAELTLTYGELDQRARAVAAWLQVSGYAGERALLLYAPGLEYLVAFFGCLYAGTIAVPVYPPRLNQSLLRLQAIAADAQASLALTTAVFQSKIEPLLATELKSLRVMATDSVADEHAQDWEEPALGAEHLAFLQYTSGSTGSPKGVMLSHRNLLHNSALLAEAFEYSSGSHCVSWLPVYHDMGLIGGVLQPLHGGYRCTLMSPASFLQSPFRWLKAITHYKATISGGPNFAYDLCVRKISHEQRAQLDLSSWTSAFNGAEPIRKETLDRFAETFADCGFRREAFYPCYGLAEATLIVTGGAKSALPIIKTIDVTALEQNKVIEASEGSKSLVSSGRSLLQQEIAVVNPHTSTLCLPGQVGEIWVSGASVAEGYWNNPTDTEHVFHAHLAGAPSAHYLRTGDLGFMHEGELFVTGRLKDLLIIRGRNLYPQDIESTVARSHPALLPEGGAAFSVDIAGEERLVIVQEVKAQRDVDLGAIIKDIREAVAKQHEVSAFAVTLIRARSLPKTSSGKIQRHACRNAYLSGNLTVVSEWKIPDATRVDTELLSVVALEPSAAAIEAWLVAQVASSLGVDAAQINAGEPIGRYGLDSLLALELTHGIEASLGVSISVSALLESASITQLAAQIMSQLTAESSSADLRPSRVPEIIVDSPLSYGQRALWFLQFLSPDSTAYNIAHAMRIHGPVNATVLRDAFQVLANRHQSLRTTFPTVDGAPVQRIQKHAAVSFSVHDATTWDESDLDARLAVEAERPFKLDEGPLLRVCLYTRAAQDHVLLLVMHHIITDFWSLAVMVHELETIYPALLAGTPATLKAPNFQYSDYVIWQSAMLPGPEGEEHWKYWRNQLADPLPVLDLYTDWTRPPVQTYRGALEVLRIDAELTQSIKAHCEANGSTLFMMLLAAFQVLLNRLTGQDDLIVGSMAAGRGRSGLSDVVGYFVNPVALRANFSGNPTFQAFLQQVRQTVLNSFRHQDYPFALLVEKLQPERDASRSPLFDVAFIFQKSHLATQKHLASFALGETGVPAKLWGLDVEPVALERHVSQFDLTLMMAEVNGGLSVSFEYNTALFAAETVKRMGSHYRNLLKSIVAAPEQRISELKLLSESESEQILKQWNATREEGLDHLCIHQLVEETAERSGEAEAVICGEQRLAYRELNERANQLAHYLLEKGVRPEVLVGVMMTRSVEMLIGVLGILKAGGAYLPLAADYPPDRLRYMVEDAGLRLILTNTQVSCVETPSIEVINLLDHKREIDQRSRLNPICSVGPENLAYVIYTSGSTGRSKGVSVIHRALSNFLNSMRRRPGLRDTHTLLAVTTLSFDIAALELFLPLIVGARLVIASREEAQDGKRLAEQLERHEVTVMQATPATWRLLLGAGWKGSSRLKMLCGGEALPFDLAEQLLGAGSSLWNMYGPTETTIWSAVSKVESLNRAVPIGLPIANTELYVLDKQLAPVPAGVLGELFIGGDGLSRGYLNHPALTAERFIPNPFSEQPGARFYRTGDQVRFLPNGQIEFLGRFDHQVKVRGFRIELGEIEARLLELAGVREAVVVVSEDQTGEKELVAYVVPEAQPETTAKQMRDHLAEKLPEYMLPMWYVMLSEMPLTLNGKVDRKALPPPSRSRLDLPGKFVPPRTPKEELIANIWSQVLQIDRLSVYDNFFALGGHSLRATQVISRLREVFQVELPPHSLFKSPTIAGLSEVLAALTQSEPGLPLVPVNRTGPLPLSFAQQRIWFMDQLERSNTVFNMLVGFRLQGSLNVEALEQALNEIVRRHEVLRSVFIDAAGEPLQSIDPILQMALRTFDLTGLPDSERDTETQRLVIEEAERPFDLAHGPLLRANLFHLDEQEHVLVAATHHIVSDGWSLGIFVRELGALYEAFSKNQPSPLETLPIQYVDYAYWQSQRLQGEALDQELAYWKQRLVGAPPLLELPFARPRPAVRTHGCAHQHLQLPQDLVVSLRALSRREGVTLFMTLMAAFQALLCYYSGQNDVVVGTDVANRNRVETEGLIGLFVNQVVMRTDLSGDPTFSELLARVREIALGAYAHQEIPFEKLVEALKPKRSLSHTPLFQIVFTLQNMPEQPFELSDLTVRFMDVEPRAAKYDLTFFMHETEQGLAGSLEYNIDLFDATSSARITSDFEMLLRYVASRPDARLSVLKGMLTKNERQQEKMKRTEHRVSGLESFKSIKPKAVNLAPEQLVKTSYLQPGSALPLVLQPEIEDVDPAEWARHNLKFIESSLLQHGALLFRGFDVRDAPRFERFASAIRPDLFNENGEHPREQVAGNVYTPVFYPPEEQLLWHNENSFNYRWPAKIWFCCLHPPTEGGETPIVDSRKVYDLIDPQVRQRFEERKVMYVRNHWQGFGLSWQTLFRTTDKSEVADQCRKAGIEFEWKEGDGLITRQVRPSVIRHPQTGEMSWFNQIQHWHISCLKPAVRRSLLSQFKEEDLPRHAYYGDGTPIEDSVIAEILEVYRQLEVSFPWQANDILMVDNISTAHGRNPFLGKRTMLVALAEMLSYADV